MQAIVVAIRAEQAFDRLAELARESKRDRDAWLIQAGLDCAERLA